MNKHLVRSCRPIPPHKRGGPISAGVSAALFLLLIPPLWGAGPASGLPASPEGGGPDMSLEQRYGIKVVGIHLTAAGYMLDFRFRVLDPARAGYLFDMNVKPCLVDQASGARMMVPAPPKIGALRSSAKTVLPDRNYFILFANPGQFIKPGNKVTVEIGVFKVADLVVQ